MNHDLLIVGAGPAGLTAGIYGARGGLDTVVIERGIVGGLASEAPVVENFPGFEEIRGGELVERMKEHTSKYVEIRELESVKSIEKKEEFVVSTDKGVYYSKALILATGTTHRKLGVKGEEELFGRGVSYCATCDGFFFKNKKIAVIGGGNTAIADAIYLRDIGCDVTVIHRRDELRAEKSLQKKLKGVKILWDSVVEEIRGDESVKSILIYNKKEDRRREIEVDGVFICVGERPNNELAIPLGIKLDEGGYIITDKYQRTNIPRIYAAGDITGGIKQIVVACGEGAVAALSAQEDLRF
ncbi:MAG: thioredoxin-disulfide reductase [Candidatus Syntropharchaeia archaeon]